MRPIILDLEGFASFRAPARVDFTDADFFALVGPTGSGKSTIIDAMTFALYGSVPRWGRKGMVSLALAPTTTRATVKLVFEAGGQRYVVARELRRVGGQVSQRAAALERITGPDGLAGPGEPTEPLAKERGVAEAVERLLGLSYEDFCQCVVLPQGQFAAFLHAKASERQEILLRLLGAERYQQIMKRANQRAGEAAQRAATWTETLAAYADATQEAEDTARAAGKALGDLQERVRIALPGIHSAGQEQAAADEELARLEREQTTLAAVQVPAGVAQLDTDLAAAQAALARLRAAERDAGSADTSARQALAAGPQRAPLERIRGLLEDQEKFLAERPVRHADATKLADVAGQAGALVAAATAKLEDARVQRDEAASRAATAAQAAHDLGAACAALAAVGMPDGVAELSGRVRAATETRQDAQARLDQGEQAEAQARAALQSAADPARLERMASELGELDDLVGRLADAQTTAARTRTDRESADGQLEAAAAEQEKAQLRLDEARRAGTAADLRAHLVRGEPCPVCDQTVATLPSPPDLAAVAGAERELAAISADREAAGQRQRRCSTAEAQASAALTSLTDQRARHLTSLRAALAGSLPAPAHAAVAGLLDQEAPSRTALAAAQAQVNEVLQARRDLERTAQEATDELTALRLRARQAEQAVTAADHETAAARDALRAARDPLVALGAPAAADRADLAAAWTELARWASGQAKVRGEQLATARQEAEELARQLEAARARFAEADTALTHLQAGATAAERQEQDAATKLSELDKRISEVADQLRGAPGDEEIAAQLALRERLETEAAQADARLIGARADREQAEHKSGELEQAGAAARERLSATRDPLVALGAPRLDPASLLAGWTALADWATQQAQVRQEGIAPAREQAAAARDRAGQLTSELAADLARGGVDIAAGAVASGAAAAVATAAERARAATARISERRDQAAELRVRRDAAQAERDVAKMLGDLLRSDRFQRWLVTAAVDGLVEQASRNLAGLSEGQFDLAHEDGEFFVIDHADADSRRSVRTLSGGETFQASLALALALSEQMTALAAAGAARLDSIFLDEGFGTLDPDTLDVVAATLETLAHGDRMVGVITHVAALADRVPVRFRVSRDARTSTVGRESIPAPAAGA